MWQKAHLIDKGCQHSKQISLFVSFQLLEFKVLQPAKTLGQCDALSKHRKMRRQFRITKQILLVTIATGKTSERTVGSAKPARISHSSPFFRIERIIPNIGAGVILSISLPPSK